MVLAPWSRPQRPATGSRQYFCCTRPAGQGLCSYAAKSSCVFFGTACRLLTSAWSVRETLARLAAKEFREDTSTSILEDIHDFWKTRRSRSMLALKLCRATCRSSRVRLLPTADGVGSNSAILSHGGRRGCCSSTHQNFVHCQTAWNSCNGLISDALLGPVLVSRASWIWLGLGPRLFWFFLVFILTFFSARRSALLGPGVFPEPN